MTEPETLRGAVEGVERVVHLVAIRQGKRSEFEAVMSRGTRALLDEARRAGVRRFVHMSALGTTEETKDIVPYYGAKWDMEQAVRGSGLAARDLPAELRVRARRRDPPTFRKLAKLTPVTPIAGSGEQRLQPIWAEDLAACFVRALDDDGVTNRTLELGGPDVVSWNHALGATQAGARGSAAEPPRADVADARERARDRAPPRQHPAHPRPPEDDGGGRQRRHGRRRCASRSASRCCRSTSSSGGARSRAGLGARSRRAPGSGILVGVPDEGGRRDDQDRFLPAAPRAARRLNHKTGLSRRRAGTRP